MFFYICIAILVVLFIAPIVIGIACGDIELFGGCSFFALLLSVAPTIAVVDAWSSHANDISRVVAQEHRIKVYEERVESLSKRLDSFSYPDKSKISLDKDSPWAAIINALAEAEKNLAQAKDERATAIRSIEARKYGPMSGVITFVGDYQ